MNLPYGDAFLVPSTATDRVVAMLQQEQRQREAQRQQQQQALDSEFRKMYGDLRNEADVKKFSDLYNRYKQSAIDLQRLKPNDREAFLQKQLEKQNAYADAVAYARRSKQLGEEDKTLYDSYTKKPDEFEDQAGGLLALRKQLPVDALEGAEWVNPQTGQKEKINLLDFNSYRYKGDDFDQAKALKEAKGQLRYMGEKVEPVPGDDLQMMATPLQFANDPVEYKNMLLGSLYNRKGGRFAERQWNSLPKENVEAVNQQFKSIPASKWKLMTGEEKPQDLTIRESDSHAEKYAKFMAMQYAISENPVLGKPELRMNQQKKDARDFGQQKTMEGIRFGHQKQLQANALANQKELADWKKKNGLTEGKDEEAWADSYLDGLSNDLGQGFNYRTTDGKTAVENEVKLDPTLKKSLTITNAAGKPQAPDKLLYNKDTKQYRPVYYQTDDKYQPIKGADGKFAIEPQLSQPITRDQLKLALGVKTMSKSQLGAAMSDDKPAKAGGKTISKDAFRKMSVAERQKFIQEGGKYQ